ncbi:Bordetella uptake gene [Moorella glycerini]|uniref:Tripartite tricarboxylate transporter family receptor n=1 Tax=Neomoorella stamsii TaxID=1266720 RepID=A0A9X7J3Z5_9FIRM|nr:MULTISPECIES: tripartite tricarboxylate transporter substrate binding protein [Moorella]PRR73574.1 Tripartite tricarboxylate transporter family receptor [Moorella stamsii]CEP69343.1 Bordetella uptake gene [Moorella glycerini]
MLRKTLSWLLVTVMALMLLVGCGQQKPSGSSNEGRENGAGKAAESFYKDKTVTLIVPNSPGKGMDNYARMIAPYIEKYSGARITVKNIVGAGGIVGINELWKSKPDGLTIAFTSVPTILLAQLSGAEGVIFDATKLTYLARVSTEPRVFCVGGKSEFNSINDLAKAGRPIKYPSQGMDEDFFTAAVMARALGFKLNQITGYEGNADTALAVVKGEGDGHITALSDAEPMIKAGDKKPLLMFAPQRVKEYPNVPTALEVTSGESQEFMKVVTTMIEMHRSFFGPPGMDAKATAEMRAALEKALADSELLEKAKKANMPVVFMAGNVLQQKITEIAESSKKIEPILKEAIAAIK